MPRTNEQTAVYRSVKRIFYADFDTDEEALHACIRDGNVPKLRELLQSPHVGLSYRHPLGGTPLHYAAKLGDLDAIELLLAACADVCKLDCGDASVTAIGSAVQEGHRDAARRLWAAATPEDQLQRIRPFRSDLVVAAMYGRAAIVHDLLSSWPGWPQQLKDSALIWAARRWHFEVVQLLMHTVSFSKDRIQEALCLAVEKKTELPYEFRSRCEGFEYLNQQLLIALLVDAGADPNATWHNMPLLCNAAVDANCTGALKTLLEKGADPNASCKSGRSALHIVAGAVSQGQFDRPVVNEAAIRLLIQHGGSVCQPDQQGETPLHTAAFGLDLRLFQLYLSACREDQQTLLHSKTHREETLLHFAAAGGCVETMSFLISKGLDVNARNVNGWTPLLCTLVPVFGGNLRGPQLTLKPPDSATQACRYLLSFGADATVITDEGLTALHCLALYCDYDFCDRIGGLTKELLSHGTNPHAAAVLLRSAASRPVYNMAWGWRLGESMASPESFNMVASPRMPVLCWAAERGALGVLKALVAHGLDPSSLDGGVLSPTRLAVESPFLKNKPELADRIVTILLEAGAGF